MDDGASPPDAAPDASPADAAADLDAGPMCAQSLITPYNGQPCSTQTKACIDACTMSGCAGDCIAADPNPMCQNCADRAVAACVNRNGCQGAWNCYTDCVQANNCAAQADYNTCVTTHCGSLEDAWNACADPLLSGPCGTIYLDCLPM